MKYCNGFNSYLAHINNKNEDKFLKDYITKKFPNTLRWRLGGRSVNGTFYWIDDNNKRRNMKFNSWDKGHPKKYTSIVLKKYNKTSSDVTWQGVWTGSFKDYPKSAYAYICERPAKSEYLNFITMSYLQPLQQGKISKLINTKL